MAPFRWPLVQNDIDLAIEVDAARPEKSSDWDVIAAKLSNHFSTPEKPVELTGRSTGGPSVIWACGGVI